MSQTRRAHPQPDRKSSAASAAPARPVPVAPRTVDPLRQIWDQASSIDESRGYSADSPEDAMADEAAKPQSQGMFILVTCLRILGVLASIYFFLMGLDMMGSSFLVLGGKGAGELFTITDNPITGQGREL